MMGKRNSEAEFLPEPMGVLKNGEALVARVDVELVRILGEVFYRLPTTYVQHTKHKD